MSEKKLEKEFSLFIRLRDSNSEGYGQCCTCGKVIHYKDGHCGHFISRRHKATKYNEMNTALQCVSCNTYNQGQQYQFSKWIDKKYGQGTADKLEAASRSVCKRGKVDIDVMTKYYKEKVKTMKK